MCKTQRRQCRHHRVGKAPMHTRRRKLRSCHRSNQRHSRMSRHLRDQRRRWRCWHTARWSTHQYRSHSQIRSSRERMCTGTCRRCPRRRHHADTETSHIPWLQARSCLQQNQQYSHTNMNRHSRCRRHREHTGLRGTRRPESRSQRQSKRQYKRTHSLPPGSPHLRLIQYTLHRSGTERRHTHPHQYYTCQMLWRC